MGVGGDDHTQERLAAGHQAQTSTQTDTSGPAQRQTDGEQPRGEALRLPGPRRHDARQPFREDATGTPRVGTDELADAELPPDTSGAPGQIGECARIAAVDTTRAHSADRAGHGPLYGGHAQDQQRCGVVQVPRIELK
jgi:hypothetical protein